MLLVFSGVFTFLVDAYPLYAASALGANSFARSTFAAAFPLFGIASKLYTKTRYCLSKASQANQRIRLVYNNLGYQWATSLLAFLSLAMAPFP